MYMFFFPCSQVDTYVYKGMYTSVCTSVHTRRESLSPSLRMCLQRERQGAVQGGFHVFACVHCKETTTCSLARLWPRNSSLALFLSRCLSLSNSVVSSPCSYTPDASAGVLLCRESLPVFSYPGLLCMHGCMDFSFLLRNISYWQS